MSASKKPGIVALKAVAGLDGDVSARSVAFALAPRLNAAGRLGRADAGLHLLTSTDILEARRIAQVLDDTNQERQEIQKWTQEEADYLLSREVDLRRDKVIVLASENFHPGVIGIVASRFAQMHYRPTVMIAIKNGMGKGSARSIPTFNLFKAFKECSQHLTQYGGHAYAAGMNIEKDRIAAFRQAMNAVGERILTGDKMIPEVRIDSELELEKISLDCLQDICRMEPFGQGNPAPVFLTRDVTIQDVRFIGQEGRHVRFRAVRGKETRDVIGFNMGDAFQDIEVYGGRFNLAYELQSNEWNGKTTVQMKLLDLKTDLLA
jgi:single-stranded-DNA-specific exonuclease